MAPDEPHVVHIDPRLRDLVPVFLENRRKDAAALREALAGGNFESIRMVGHSMKGAGGGYGFDRISELGRGIEEAARTRDAARIRGFVDDLAAYLDRVRVVTDEAPARKDEDSPVILSVDDDPDIQALLNRLLGYDGFRVIAADGAATALALLKTARPDLILLDVMMPGMDGYALCTRLQNDETACDIPVIFVTALGDEQNKARAFAAGGADYLVKPVHRDLLRRKVTEHLETHRRWCALRDAAGDAATLPRRERPGFLRFKKLMLARMRLDADAVRDLFQLAPRDLYAGFGRAGVAPRALARAIADFLKLPYRERVDADHLQLGMLPTPFCRHNSVVAVNRPSEGKAFVLSNPFDRPLMDALKRFRSHAIAIAEPAVIAALVNTKEARTP